MHLCISACSPAVFRALMARKPCGAQATLDTFGSHPGRVIPVFNPPMAPVM